MRARFMIENPETIEASMKITMTIGQWVLLRDILTEKHIHHYLSSAITDIVIDARRIYYPNPTTEREQEEGVSLTLPSIKEAREKAFGEYREGKVMGNEG